MLKYSTFFLASLLTSCFAGPLAPLQPAPNNQFTEGGPLSISWSPDTTGAWKVTNIELMTGNNFDMVHLTTLATVDGTDAKNASITVPCPSVTPHSAIYFLQFSTVGQVMWTGRFSIVGSDGTTVPPSNATQPDGSNIPWGTGMLVAPSFPGSPPPSTAPSGQIDASGASGSAGTSSSVSSSTGSSNSTEGLSASSSSSSSPSTSSSSSPSVPTITGPLPGESTPSAGGSSSSPQPSSQPDQTPTTNSTAPPSTTSQSSAISAIHTYPILALVPMLVSTSILGANLF